MAKDKDDPTFPGDEPEDASSPESADSAAGGEDASDLTVDDILGAAAFVLELGDLSAPARLRLFLELSWGARVRVRELSDRVRTRAGLIERLIRDLFEVQIRRRHG